MDINGYVPFLIATMKTIVRGVKILAKSVVTRSRLPDVGAAVAQDSCHAADAPRGSEGRPPRI